MAKLGIELDGALEIGNGLGIVKSQVLGLAEAQACKASSDEVVACSSGVANFCTEPMDSPSLPRKLEAAWSSDFEDLLLALGFGLFAGPGLCSGRSPAARR